MLMVMAAVTEAAATVVVVMAATAIVTAAVVLVLVVVVVVEAATLAMVVAMHRGVQSRRGSSRFSEKQTFRADAVEGYVNGDDRSTDVVAGIVLLVEESNRRVRRFRSDSEHEEEKGIR